MITACWFENIAIKPLLKALLLTAFYPVYLSSYFDKSNGKPSAFRTHSDALCLLSCGFALRPLYFQKHVTFFNTGAVREQDF